MDQSDGVKVIDDFVNDFKERFKHMIDAAKDPDDVKVFLIEGLYLIHYGHCIADSAEAEINARLENE